MWDGVYVTSSMLLYERDAYFFEAARRPEYTHSYKGFSVGRKYPNYYTFSSRPIFRGKVWPTQEVRDMWETLRKTQITTVPGGAGLGHRRP